MTEIIKEGDYVIIAKSDCVLRLVQVRKDRPVFLGKRKIRIGSCIGHPYEATFKIKSDGHLEVETIKLSESLKIETNVDSEMKDNRFLNASERSQKLTTQDIEAFKAGGVSGEEIVKIIVENSSSFKEKTSFSREKYVKKKQLKYVNVMQILKPNPRLIVETFYLYSPQKICNLRMDSLSQMLTFCNIMSGGNYIVVDSVLGLLAASVLDRIGTQGVVLQMSMTSAPPNVTMHAVNALNLSGSILQEHLYLMDLHKALALLTNNTVDISDQAEVSTLQNNPVGDDAEGVEEKDVKHKRNEKRSFKQLIFRKATELLNKKSMDALLIAVKHHPSSAIPLLDFLACSRPFAIYSMYQEPLVECYSILKKRGDIIMLNMSESWLRKYQVLPDRTHPEYSMSSNSGYLLTGIRVETKRSF